MTTQLHPRAGDSVTIDADGIATTVLDVNAADHAALVRGPEGPEWVAFDALTITSAGEPTDPRTVCSGCNGRVIYTSETGECQACGGFFAIALRGDRDAIMKASGGPRFDKPMQANEPNALRYFDVQTVRLGGIPRSQLVSRVHGWYSALTGRIVQFG